MVGILVTSDGFWSIPIGHNFALLDLLPDLKFSGLYPKKLTSKLHTTYEWVGGGGESNIFRVVEKILTILCVGGRKPQHSLGAGG